MLLLFVLLIVPIYTKVYDPNTIPYFLESVSGFPTTIMDGIIVFDIPPLVGNSLGHFTTHEINY